MPIEFTPATAGTMADLVAGRPVAQPTRVGRPVGAPPGRVDFLANVDGPWPTRDLDEFAVELDRLVDRIAVLRAAGTDRPAEGFSPAEQFTQGVQAAANWTLGVTTKAPFRQGPTVVSDAMVAEKLKDADLLIRVDPRLEHYAGGVRAWLQWLMGAGESIVYPPT